MEFDLKGAHAFLDYTDINGCMAISRSDFKVEDLASAASLHESLDVLLKAAVLFRAGASIPEQVRHRHLFQLGIGWGVHAPDMDPKVIPMASPAEDEIFARGVLLARESTLSVLERDHPHLILGQNNLAAQCLLFEEALRNTWGISLEVTHHDTRLAVSSPNGTIHVQFRGHSFFVALQVPRGTPLSAYTDAHSPLLKWGLCAQMALCNDPKGIEQSRDLANMMGTWWAQSHSEPVKMFSKSLLEASFQRGFLEGRGIVPEEMT
jgi:hypothetical protein